MSTSRVVFAVSMCVALCVGPARVLWADEAADPFVKSVWPVLEARCVECHGPDKQKGKLRLDSAEAIAKGGEDGAVIVAGKPEESDLFKRITLPAGHDDIMPPKGDPLKPEEQDAIKKWIADGAKFGDWKEAEKKPADAPAKAAEVAPSDAGVKTAEAMAPAAEKADALAELAKSVQPAAPEALAAITAIGGQAAPLSQDNPLVRVDLHLLGQKVTDEQLALLAPLKDQIVWLNLAGTAVTDAGLANLASLANLTRLNLEKTAVTDAGLEHLRGLQRLEYLNLYGTVVSDAGLASIEPLKNLKHVYLWKSAVTQAGADKLKQVLPGVDVNMGTELAAAPAAAPAAELKFDEGSCCAQAKAAGKTCDHPCCKEAAAAGKVCAKCNPKSAA